MDDNEEEIFCIGRKESKEERAARLDKALAIITRKANEISVITGQAHIPKAGYTLETRAIIDALLSLEIGSEELYEDAFLSTLNTAITAQLKREKNRAKLATPIIIPTDKYGRPIKH